MAQAQCFHTVPLRFDDIRGAEAPGGLALASQQVLGSLHVVREPGSEGSHRGPHQQRRGTHSYSHCRSSCVICLQAKRASTFSLCGDSSSERFFFSNGFACPASFFSLFRS